MVQMRSAIERMIKRYFMSVKSCLGWLVLFSPPGPWSLSWWTKTSDKRVRERFSRRRGIPGRVYRVKRGEYLWLVLSASDASDGRTRIDEFSPLVSTLEQESYGTQKVQASDRHTHCLREITWEGGGLFTSFWAFSISHFCLRVCCLQVKDFGIQWEKEKENESMNEGWNWMEGDSLVDPFKRQSSLCKTQQKKVTTAHSLLHCCTFLFHSHLYLRIQQQDKNQSSRFFSQPFYHSILNWTQLDLRSLNWTDE